MNPHEQRKALELSKNEREKGNGPLVGQTVPFPRYLRHIDDSRESNGTDQFWFMSR